MKYIVDKVSTIVRRLWYNLFFIICFILKVAVATALGAGVVVGAGLAYVINRVNEHTHLTQQISSLHETILQVRRDLASLETGKFYRSFLIFSLHGNHPTKKKKVLF